MIRFEYNLEDGYICLDLVTKRMILWFIIPFILCNHYISSGNGQAGSRTDNRMEYEAMAPDVSLDNILKTNGCYLEFYWYQIHWSSKNKLSFYRKMNIMGWQIILKCQDYSEDILGENTKMKLESPRMIFTRTELKKDNWFASVCAGWLAWC